MDKRSLIDMLDNTNLTMFDDPDANAAGERLNHFVARMIEADASVKEPSLIEKIHLTQDAVLVSEAMVNMLQDNQSARDLICEVFDEESVWMLIAHWKTTLDKTQDELIALKRQLSS